MKQGILITAYKNFNHLIDIVNYFDDNFEFYIHIDKKSKIEVETLEHINTMRTVKLVSQKFTVNWGGLNHLKAILFLCEEALKNKDLKVFHLISGHDYPIKPNQYFSDFYKDNLNTDFFSYFELPSTKWTEGGYDRLWYYNLYDLVDAKKHRPYILKLVQYQKKLNFKRTISNWMPKLYGGETWWSLSRETLSYVMKYTKSKKQLINRLKYTFCSEEIYFQTVIMNSPLSSKNINDSLRYIDWTKRNGNFPANLDMNDFEKLKSSSSLFARKFDFPISTDLKSALTNEEVRENK